MCFMSADFHAAVCLSNQLFLPNMKQYMSPINNYAKAVVFVNISVRTTVGRSLPLLFHLWLLYSSGSSPSPVFPSLSPGSSPSPFSLFPSILFFAIGNCKLSKKRGKNPSRGTVARVLHSLPPFLLSNTMAIHEHWKQKVSWPENTNRTNSDQTGSSEQQLLWSISQFISQTRRASRAFDAVARELKRHMRAIDIALTFQRALLVPFCILFAAHLALVCMLNNRCAILWDPALSKIGGVCECGDEEDREGGGSWVRTVSLWLSFVLDPTMAMSAANAVLSICIALHTDWRISLSLPYSACVVVLAGINLFCSVEIKEGVDRIGFLLGWCIVTMSYAIARKYFKRQLEKIEKSQKVIDALGTQVEIMLFSVPHMVVATETE